MQYTPSVTPAVLSASTGIGAAALLPVTGATQLNALAIAAATVLVIWTLYYMVIRKRLG